MLFNLGLLLIPPPIDAGAESEMASTNSQTDSDSISIMPYFDSVSFHSCVELDATVLPSQSAPNEIKPEPFVTDRAALLEATKVAPVPEIITELEKQRLKLAAFQLIRKRKNRFDKIST